MSSSNRSSGDSELFTSALSEVSRPARTIRLRDIYNPPPPPQRKPVAIRPPSPGPPPHPSVLPESLSRRRSFSCEPEPKAIMRRRAHSLPSSDETTTRKSLQVRFVDCLGLELEHVKFFRAGEDPKVPDHVINRLLASSELASGRHLELSLPFFQPFFPENISIEPDFLERLCHRRVCLEQVHCSELGITGTVQVLNLAFEKQVIVRYSFTDWKSSAECKACWVSTEHRDDVQSEVFHFRLPVPPFILKPGASLEFAICYRVLGSEYWDNNDGHNYKLACHAYKLIVPKECEDSMVVLPDDWETTAEVIRETGRKVLGVSSGRRKEDKETWWWNEEVQDSIQRKRLAKKKWDMDRTEENRQEYKELQRRVKREVSKAKQKAYDELYTRLDTREGEKDLYRLARQRDRDGKDVQQVRVIKDRDGRVLTSEESVQRRWKEYFEELMNEENEREKKRAELCGTESR
ncbi:hypothetical protein QTP86_002929 [Hemibagrus guttatus]|nr:hypothetical protein QTP86_002929 [Hemibagrus guttatus]